MTEVYRKLSAVNYFVNTLALVRLLLHERNVNRTLAQHREEVREEDLLINPDREEGDP